MKTDVKNVGGAVLRSIELPPSVFGLEMNEPVLHAVCKAYAANRRQGTHATKTRALVSGTGKKPFKQKGTGRARQGCSRSPLMPGGAVVHGPQPRSYRQGTSKKLRQLALRVALSDKVRYQKLLILDDFAVREYSTKHVVKTLDALGVRAGAYLIDVPQAKFLRGSAANVPRILVGTAELVTAEDVLRFENMVISEQALAALIARLGGDAE